MRKTVVDCSSMLGLAIGMVCRFSIVGEVPGKVAVSISAMSTSLHQWRAFPCLVMFFSMQFHGARPVLGSMTTIGVKRKGRVALISQRLLARSRGAVTLHHNKVHILLEISGDAERAVCHNPFFIRTLVCAMITSGASAIQAKCCRES